MANTPDTATNADRLVGQEAIVLSEVNAHDGRVRLEGNEWSARAYLDDEEFPEGATVDVIQIEGATALVSG